MPMLIILGKATCLLCVALVATAVMQRRSAGARHLVWLTALGALLLLPLLAVWSPIPLRILPAAMTPLSTASDGASNQLPTNPLPSSGVDRHDKAASPNPPALGAAPVTNASTSSGFVERLTGNIAQLLVAIWAVVALVLAGWLAYGMFAVRRIVRRAMPLESHEWQGPLCLEIADRLNLGAAPRLLRSDDVKMPFACGLIACTIVLPAESDGWSAERRSAVLIHELGHVRRRDLIGHTLGRFASVLYWFHPMVWTAARRLRAESERACDDLALTFGAKPSEYAEHLLDIVTCVRDHATPSVALAMAHRREFEGRMLAILNPELLRTSPSRWQTASLVGALAALAVVVSAAAPMRRVENVGAPAAPIGMLPSAPEKLPVHTDVAVNRVMSTAINLKSKKSVHVEGAPSDDTTGRAARTVLLAHTLRDDADAGVRRTAAWGLAGFDSSPVAIQALATALGHDGDARVREMSAWALSGSDDQSVVDALTNAARHDYGERVRETAIWALGSRQVAADAPLIAGVLGADKSALVRSTAAWALGSLDLKTAPKSLLAALTDSVEDVRYKAAWAVGQIEDSNSLPSLRLALKRESAERVQRVLLRALITSGEDPERMVEWLKSNNPDLRQMAARALAGSRSVDPWPWPWPRPMPTP